MLIQSVLQEDGDLAAMEEDWMETESDRETTSDAGSTGYNPPPPPPAPSPIVNHTVYGFDWPEAVGPGGPNGIVFGSEDGSEESVEGVWVDWVVEPEQAPNVAGDEFGVLDVAAAFRHARLG